MPLSSKLIADYNELISPYLDSIPINNEDEFSVVSEALSSIIQPSENHNVTESLKGRIESLQEIMDSPEDYVENPKDYPEFKEIILKRVTSKIKEINTLKPNEKSQYIRDQQLLKSEGLKNKMKMASMEPPAEGSEAHTISFEDWLRTMESVPVSNAMRTNIEDMLSECTEKIHELEAALNSIIDEGKRNGASISIGQMFKTQLLMNELEQNIQHRNTLNSLLLPSASDYLASLLRDQL